MTTRLPLRVEPLPGEWWRSYIVRVADIYGVQPLSVLERVHGIVRVDRRHFRWSGIALSEAAARDAGRVVNLEPIEIQSMQLSAFHGSALNFACRSFDHFNPANASALSRLPLTEEYRKPTPEELKGFIDHFGKRRVELGDCMRPYGTNCIHQHACLRCDFLAIDAAAAPRLDRIEGNVTAQLTAAKDNKWLCDVEQLQLTLGSLHDKREGLQARSKRGTDELTFEHTQPIELRLPSPDPTA